MTRQELPPPHLFQHLNDTTKKKNALKMLIPCLGTFFKHVKQVTDAKSLLKAKPSMDTTTGQGGAFCNWANHVKELCNFVANIRPNERNIVVILLPSV